MFNGNIIPFPAAAAKGRAMSAESTAQGDAVVIDLAAHRRPGAAALQPVDIWNALNDGRVAVHYQPQFDLLTGEIVAAEALVRLIDTDAQLIYPDRFINMIEADDLIVPLGRAVISQVCADLAASRAKGATIRRMAINLAAQQLNMDHELPQFIDHAIRDNELRYEDLEFELTERQRLTPECVGIARFKALVERGSRIVLDDFGMGYSSVDYLTELPITALKLDRALVRRLASDPGARWMLKVLLSLAASRGLEVIAEGIETAAQSSFLRRAGCSYGQGFGYARPMAINALQTLLQPAAGSGESNDVRVGAH